MASTAGLVLAAGAGVRFGGPKALARTADGEPWLQRAVATLRNAGCASVTVVLGADAEHARPLVPDGLEIVAASNWHAGMSASLAAGLAALGAADDDPVAALITLVDLPGLPVAACARVLGGDVTVTTLRQAVYRGAPGHPVLAGRDHWPAMRASLRGDRGARAYLVAHAVTEVECGDLFSGADIDTRRPGD